VGGANGTILVSTGTESEVFANSGLGDVGGWVKVETPESTSYSRSLRVMGEDGGKLLIIGGGVLPPATNNSVTVTLMDLKGGEVFNVDD